MKRVVSCAVLACVAAVTLSAQTPPPSETPQTPSAAAKQTPSSAENKVTVTGCLERSKPTAASPTGTSGAATASDTTKFVLNNVTASPAAAETAGTSGSARPVATSYRLDADETKLTAHVGHKVSITGSVENRMSAMGAEKSASAPKLKVESVTHIAPSCTP